MEKKNIWPAFLIRKRKKVNKMQKSNFTWSWCHTYISNNTRHPREEENKEEIIINEKGRSSWRSEKKNLQHAEYFLCFKDSSVLKWHRKKREENCMKMLRGEENTEKSKKNCLFQFQSHFLHFKIHFYHIYFFHFFFFHLASSNRKDSRLSSTLTYV